jgi:hypothetical protein
MSKVILIICLFISVSIWGQNQDTIYNKATKYLKANEIQKAIRYYQFANNIHPRTELGQCALEKVDSLKPIVRKTVTDKLIGNWKMVDPGSNWVIRDDNLVAKMITISLDEIKFFELYKNSKNWTLIKSEKLIFLDKAGIDLFYTEIVYSNKEIWDYTIDDDSGQLTVRYTGEETDTGRTEIVCGTTETNYFRLQ